MMESVSSIENPEESSFTYVNKWTIMLAVNAVIGISLLEFVLHRTRRHIS